MLLGIPLDKWPLMGARCEYYITYFFLFRKLFALKFDPQTYDASIYFL